MIGSESDLPIAYRISLAVLYLLVFIGGIVGVIIMSTTIMSNMLSVTRVSMINLLVLHLIFLLTVPFRVYYYVANKWELGSYFCKLVSSMLHGHMYLSFIFYAIILCNRYLTYFEWRHRQEFYRELHAVIASVTIWAIILAIVIPSTINYGTGTDKPTLITNNVTQCFAFGTALINKNVKVMNYIICSVVLLIWVLLASCQFYIMWRVRQKHGEFRWVHQEFWAQIKSLCFVLIMLICFVPYQAFRIYYAYTYWPGLEKVNEVFLAVTAFSCFDMLLFAGREVCQSAYKMCCIT
ncbi:hypothetical protein Q7C36_004854 [Tachysurus vachellii]|uniref:G-protein coupled receptors family 1 profile domain-containing protein n=1 Tax=Tachysurus vachellii TaxID=175792 RepID=A0AA88T6C7_TACVA|nr:hypothetical protein Q7C36_004854 [Tachysurus vachellii]